VGTGYLCTVRGGHKPYPPGSFDFLAAYVVHENAWYIIPEKQICGQDGVMLYPQSPKSKYEKYREGWNQLGADRDPVPGHIDSIQGCAEEVSSDCIE
jgi:hypothetical protein